jgi:ubiquinone/menaquinone biosynthesis C-methylase UbiE
LKTNKNLYFTEELFALCDRFPVGKWLDAGAGEGATTASLREKGFSAIGIDINFKSEFVIYGDMTKIPFPDNTFDAGVCECSLSACGDYEKALEELRRVLIPGGDLFISDVRLYDLNYLKVKDVTEKFKENYFRLLWEGADLGLNVKKFCGCDFNGYFLTYLKADENGFGFAKTN